jgi:hypothetical protein
MLELDNTHIRLENELKEALSIPTIHVMQPPRRAAMDDCTR